MALILSNAGGSTTLGTQYSTSAITIDVAVDDVIAEYGANLWNAYGSQDRDGFTKLSSKNLGSGEGLIVWKCVSAGTYTLSPQGQAGGWFVY